MPGDLHPEHAGDRRQDVQRLHVPVHNAPPVLARKLHEQRRERKLREVRPGRAAAQVASAEADAVVCRYDDQRLVPEPRLVQAAQEGAHQPVGEADLEQVPLPGLHRELGIEPALAVAAGRIRRRDSPGMSIREVQPGRVRQEHMDEVERRRPRTGLPQRPHEAIEIPNSSDVEGLQVDLRRP